MAINVRIGESLSSATSEYALRAADAQYERAKLDVRLAEELLREVERLARVHAAPRIGITQGVDDPHLLLRLGRLHAHLDATHGLLSEAAEGLEELSSDENSIVAIEAGAFARDLVLGIATELLAAGGDVAACELWRNLAEHADERANHGNYHRVGHYYLHTPAPSDAWREHAVTPALEDATDRPARVIESEAEALAVAYELAARFAIDASARDREPKVPVQELDALSRSGLLAISVPRAYGGADVSFETLAKVFQILSAADPAIGQLPQNHFVFVDAIRQDGTRAQQEFFFRELLAGARLGNAQAERGSSSALNLSTRLRRSAAGEYRLNGTKYYCTGASAAHWIPVAALDDDERLVLAYVRRDAAGVEVRGDWNAMGQRVTFSGTSIFTDVVVPEAHVIQHWRLFERPALFHPFGQLLHAAIDVGIAQGAFEETVALIRSRKRARLGALVERATDDPHVILRIGQLATRLHAAEALLLQAARALDRAAPALNSGNAAEAAVLVSEAKAYAEDVVIEITNEVFALIGSSTTDDSLNLHRHWRNARTHTVHDANQWRYHSAGNYHVNGVLPGKPIRTLAKDAPSP